jgi:AcrR family transcriptional regulator
MEYAGGGDPARTMALLWRTAEAPKRGPKQRLDLDRIVATAIELADGGGLEAVSVRAVAQALGIAASSLYTYLRKPELLELMADQAIGSGGPVPDSLTEYAWASLALFRRHPWLLQISTARTVLGPNIVARYDAALGLLDWLPPVDRERCLATLDVYIRGAAAEVVDAEQAPARTGRSDDEWWNDYAPILDRRLADGDYPNLRALDQAGAFEPSSDDTSYTVQRALDRFTFGLEVVLEAVACRGGDNPR